MFKFPNDIEAFKNLDGYHQSFFIEDSTSKILSMLNWLIGFAEGLMANLPGIPKCNLCGAAMETKLDRWCCPNCKSTIVEEVSNGR